MIVVLAAGGPWTGREALRWYTLLDERYGPPFADPDELAALRNAVASLSSEDSAR